MDSQLTCSLRASSFAVLRWQQRELAGGHANKHVRRRTETFLLLAQLQCRHHLERIAPINQLLDTAILNCRKRIFHLARISLTPILVSYQNLRLVFTSDGVGIGHGVIIAYDLWLYISFGYSGALLWNSLPENIRAIRSIGQFKKESNRALQTSDSHSAIL